MEYEHRQAKILGDISPRKPQESDPALFVSVFHSEEENEPKALARLLVGGNRSFAKCCIECEAGGKTAFVSRQDPQYRD
jgi:hypothetical protein